MTDVLITGAGRGLGRAMADLLLERGCRVAAGDLRAEDVADLADAHGDRVLAFEMDVTDAGSCAAAAAHVEQAWGGLDGIVCNAGIPHAGSVVASPPEVVEQVVGVNLLGAYQTAHATLPLLHRRSGRVVVISSEVFRFPQAFSWYSITKIAVDAWAQALRQELQLEAMSVSVVRPGAHRTAILDGTRSSFEARSADPILGRYLPKVAAVAEAPLSKGADPVDVAVAVHHALTSDRPKRSYHVHHNPQLVAGQLAGGRLRDVAIARMLRGARG